MPGLSQLKKFNDDVLALGNEAELREQRGEKVVTVPIPNDVQDFDDSNDFMMGIADLIVDPTVANGSGNGENTSDATGSAIENQSISIPDLSSLIGESASDTASAGIPDLSMFMDDAPQAENPAPTPTQNANDFVDISLDELLGETSSDSSTGTAVKSPEPTNAEKIDDSALDISMSQNELPPIDEISADEPNEGEQILNELPNLDKGIEGTEDFSISPSTDSEENANRPSDDFTLEDISGKSSQDDDFEIPDSSVETTSSGSDVLSDLDLGASAEKNNTLPAGNLDDFTLDPLEEPAASGVNTIADTLDLPPLDDAGSADRNTGDLELDTPDDFSAGSLNLDSDSDAPASDDVLSEASSLDAAPLDEAESAENSFGDLSFDDSDDFSTGSLDLGSDGDAPASDDALSEAGSPDAALPDEAESSENGFGDLSFDD